MHVAYIVGANRGGLVHYATQLSNAVSTSADVSILKVGDANEGGPIESGIEVRNVFEPVELSVPSVMAFDVSLSNNLRGVASYSNVDEIFDIDPDVVHVPTGLFPHIQYFMQRTAVDTSYPVVLTRHEVIPFADLLSDFSRPYLLPLKALNWILPSVQIDHTIVHTEPNRRTLVNKGGDPSEISVIPHGAYDFFTDYRREDVSFEPDTLLFFGNIAPHKGLATLAEAVAAVSDDHPNVTLIIAGQGRIPRKVRSVISDHRDHFEVHNRYIKNEEVAEFFQRSAIVALPYRGGRNKGHSGTLTIAYSFGRPVITTDIGEFPELVNERRSGLTVSPGDIDEMTAAISKLLTDDCLRSEMATHARAIAQELSWDKVAEQHLDVYRNLARRV